MAISLAPLANNWTISLETPISHRSQDQIHEAFYQVSADALGFGTYRVNWGVTLEFLHRVGTGQTINLAGAPDGAQFPSALLIDDPANFHGHVVMNYLKPGPQQASEAIEVGISMLGHAVDSYSYHNDMLKLWLGNKVVETLNLTVHDPYGITVQGAPGPYIFVSANDRTSHGISFLNSPPSFYPAMPVHV
jgi:hypothetical protein